MNEKDIVVVHLGNMPIEEEECYTQAELKRRFEISERLRAAASSPSPAEPPDTCLNSLLIPQIRIAADGEEPELIKCEVCDCSEYQHCLHYCVEHHKVICTPFTPAETELIIGAIPPQALPAPAQPEGEQELRVTIERVMHQQRLARTHNPTYCCPEDEAFYDRQLTEMLVDELRATTLPTAPGTAKGWQYTHERDAELIRRDGMMCEAHPGLEFGHDPICAGPGMAWIIEGRTTIEEIVNQACRVQIPDGEQSPEAQDVSVSAHVHGEAPDSGRQVVMPAAAPSPETAKSDDAWRQWFDRMGERASAEVVNATADLVTNERLAALVQAGVLPARKVQE